MKARVFIIKGLVFYLFFVFLSTELLSSVNGLNQTNIRILYTISLVIFILFLRKNISRIKSEISRLLALIKKHYVFFLGAGIILLPLLFIALYYPPNNWDSMTYHMARVEHWIQNKNVDFYPTNNDRQLFMGPLAEYVILHIKLLFGDDRFVNLVQYFAMFGSVITATLITDKLSYKNKHQLFAALLVLTIPMGILQSTTTQTDYLSAFLLISLVYFGFQQDTLFIAFACGLGLLTKLSFLLFTIPFSIYFGILWFKSNKAYFIKSLLIAMMISLIVNLPLFIRNFKTYETIYGPISNSKILGNQSLQPIFVLSTLVKNTGLNLGLPNDNYNHFIDQIITKFHDLIGININDNNNTFINTYYLTHFLISEDVSGNISHAILFVICGMTIGFCFKRYSIKNKYLWPGYFLCIISGFILYSTFFKWQPWGNRLLLPLTVTACPLMAVVLSEAISSRKALLVVSALLWICALPFVAGNMIINWKGLLTLSGSARQLGLTMFQKNGDRYERYFYLNSVLYKPYLDIAGIINNLQINHIGLDLGGDSWEYPLWVKLKQQNPEIKINYIRKFYRIAGKNSNLGFKYRVVIYDNLDTEKLFDPLIIRNKYDFGHVKMLVLTQETNLFTF